MIFRKYFTYISMLICTALIADTSVFSSLSLGDIEPSFKYTTGMSTVDSISVSNHNYSTWTYKKNSTFSVAFSFSAHQLTDSEDNTSSYDNFTIEEMSFALPFGDQNVFGVAFYPTSIVDMTNVSTDPLEVEESFENTFIKTLQTKVGSLTNLSLIYGKKLNEFSFSLDASSKFGNYDTNKRYKYATYSDDVVLPDDDDIPDWVKYFEKNEKLQIFHVTIGTSFMYRTPFGVNLGGNISFPISTYGSLLQEINNTTSYGTVIQEIDSEENEVTNIEWPMEFAAGISYNIYKFKLSYDFAYKGFKDLNIGFGDIELKDYYRSSAGIRYRESMKRLDPYYKKITYSAFFTHEIRPYQFEGSDITDISATLAFQFPYNKDRSAVEILFSYINSGTDLSNSLTEDTFKCTVNFNLSDNWWLKKERYSD